MCSIQKMWASGSFYIKAKGCNLSDSRKCIVVMSDTEDGLWGALEFEMLHNPGILPTIATLANYLQSLIDLSHFLCLCENMVRI